MMEGTYSGSLVSMSILIAVLAAYTAIDMARRIAASGHGGSAGGWLAGGALAMGTGVWSMHFVGMLAYSLPIPMGYDARLTILSWVVGVASCAFGLWLTTREKLPVQRIVLGAIVMGGGLMAMHSMGMIAMRMQPAIVFDRGLVALALAIGVTASGAALVIIHHLRAARGNTFRLRLAAAPVIAAGLAAMHYTGTAAANFPLGSVCGAAAAGAQTDWLASLVIVGALGILTMALIVSVFDQRLEARNDALAASRAHAKELSHMALHDSLTGLPNRVLLEDRLARSADPDARFAVMFLDLDSFKVVNDVYGHHTGDLLLIEIARRLRGLRRHADTVSRQGGDEFVLLVHAAAAAEVEDLARRILDRVREPVTVGEHVLHITASLGIALYPQHGTDPATLLSNADAAMYHVKDRGRNAFCLFRAEMNALARTQLDLTQALAPAMERREFYLLYQPKYRAADQALVGVEALVRWEHPGRGTLGPDLFIPLAERAGLIVELGAWIIDEACRQLSEWQRAGATLQMSVNLSTLQFCSVTLVEDVRASIQRHGVKAENLMLEITESTAMRDVEHSLRLLRELRALGVRISIDDFGTGYSNLVYLKQLPASELKIDRAFVTSLRNGREDVAIVEAIIALGKTLGLTVTAEGVETVEQQDFLTRGGCDLLQGYLLGRPMQASALPLRFGAA